MPAMFSVLFEVRPATEHHDTYLGLAKMLRPELERVDGFIDNLRYRSLTRPGWLLSLSGWRDEKALVRWRTAATHHGVQERGRDGVLGDYRLRVGQITQDTQLPAGQELREQRLDETQHGAGAAVVLVDARQAPEWVAGARPEAVAQRLGLAPAAPGLVAWDVFDAVLAPGDVILMATLRTQADAAAFEQAMPPVEGCRVRRVRIVREYGKYDRREAPQFYPDAAGAPTIRD
jgi:heme-degrading monooxygenase HmoA